MEHGKRYTYTVKGCRCEQCRAWRSKVERAYRQRRKARTGERMVRGRFVKPEPEA